MSRHAKFYSALKRGDDDYDDYDDNYDYEDDEDYYEEETRAYCVATTTTSTAQQGHVTTRAGPGQQPLPQTQPKQLGGVGTANGKGVAGRRATDDEGIPLDAPDYELVSVQAKMLREVVNAPIASILSALREANYDIDAASLALMPTGRSGGTTPLGGSNMASPQGSTVYSPTDGKSFPKTSGGKTLKLGGATSSNTAASPTANNANAAPSASTSDLGAPDQPGKSPVAAPRASYGAATSVVDEDGKQACTVVIAGHVDSGKSTILGHVLYQLGTFTDRDVDRNEKEGRMLGGKQSFKYAWLLDQSEEERRRGVTIDSGAQVFETEHKRVNVLDAPGHKDFVMNMIASATQADVALLVVTAAIGEFESGLQHGTKEHLTILRTLGVGKLLVAVNKMDTVDYSKDRYDYVVQQVSALMRQTRYKESDVLCFCPVSGIAGVNLTQEDRATIPWYTGLSLLHTIDAAPVENRLVDGPLRLSLQDVQKQTLYCRVEAGRVAKGDAVLFVPCGVKLTVKGIDRLSTGSGPSTTARAGETVELTTNSDLLGLYAGCVGCNPKQAHVGVATEFECHIQTFGNLANAILPGASFMLAVHALTVPVRVQYLVAKMDKSGAWSKGLVKCIPRETQAIVVMQSDVALALEPAEVVRALGRFVLRQGGETVAGGLVTKLMPYTPQVGSHK